ncbi:hypothetical protein KAR91_23490, partial [Candidatus Pacearchaeota archaeon]|nr:hypothetical protein [Candidatus Pacearchaeota archaeon]
KAGDIASNRKNGTKTTVSVDAILEGEVSVTDDIFVSGDDYEIIKLSPEGLGNNRENVGSAFNSSGSDLTKVLKNGQAKITTSFWNTSNGHGSSSTKIQKFVTEVDASDDVVVTIVNSATLGFVITANMSCKLHITYNAAFNIGGWLGISKNSTQLTLGVSSISATDRMALTTSPNADEPGSVSWSGILAINDVIRPHTNGSVDGATPSFSSIHVLAEEII